MSDNEKNFRQILEDILENLNTVFLSEADFQFTLAWKIKERLKGNGEVILEFPKMVTDKDKKDKNKTNNIYYDIYVKDEKEDKHLIELKYRTKKAKITRHGKEFDLKNQSANDLGRYHFIADIERLENQNIAKNSYCIMLTNDSAYWKGPKKFLNTRDKNFRIHDGAEINGNLHWNLNGEGKKDYMGKHLEIKHHYSCKWQDYCNFEDIDTGKPSEFRYLLLEISQENNA